MKHGRAAGKRLVGTDLTRAIRSLRPDIPVVLMSGYGSMQLHERARAAGIAEILGRPLQTRDLAECLGRVLRSIEQHGLVPLH